MKNKAKARTMKQDKKRELKPKLRFPEFRDAEGWEAKSLSAIAENLDNKRVPITESNREKGAVPYYGASGIVDYVKKFLFDEDLLCISEDGANLVARTYPIAFSISGKTWVNNHAHVLRFANRATQTVVEEYLNSIDLSDFITGMAQPKLNKAMLDSIPVPLSSIAEQQRIASFLTSLDELIAAEGRKLDALKSHKKGLMQQLFPREGETLPRLRFPEFRNTPEWKGSPFYDLLDDVLDFRGRTPKKLGMEWGNGSVISLSANNVKNGFIDFRAECNLGSEDLYARWMGDVNLEKSDIVFTMEAPLGNALLIPDSVKYILSQRVVAFKAKDEVINAFLIQLIWAESFQSEINKLATGSTAKGISQKVLQNVPVSLPNTDEQQKIADCLSCIDNLITAQTQKIDTLKTHKKGLMQQLFPSPEER